MTLVNTPDLFLDFLDDLSQENLLFIDTETSGLDPHKAGARICGIVVGFNDKRTFYIPIRHLSDEPQLEPAWALRLFSSRLMRKARTLVFHNGKFDVMMFRADGIELYAPTKDGQQHTIHDTMLMSKLLDEGRYTHGLKQLGRELIDPNADLPDKLHLQYMTQHGLDRDAYGDAQVPPSVEAQYAEQDVILTKALYDYFRPRIKAEGMTEVYTRERLLLPVVVDMEWRGLMVDRQYCQDAIDLIQQETARSREALQRYAEEAGVYTGPKILKSGKLSTAKQGDPFQSKTTLEKIALGLQLVSDKLTPAAMKLRREIAADGEEIVAEARGKSLEKIQELASTKSWDKTVLDANDHPFCHELLNYRQLMKLEGTYFRAFLARTDDDYPFLHPSFNQAATLTGRFSSSNPNFQNLPTPTRVKGEHADRLRVKSAVRPRPGYCFLGADYSAMEYAMLAHLSQEPALLETFRGENPDPHKATAREIWSDFYGVSEERQKELRQLAKVLNFALIYGAGGKKLAGMLGLASEEEGKDLKKRYFAAMPGVNKLRSSIYRKLEVRQPVAPDDVDPATWRPGPWTKGPLTLRNLYGRTYHFKVRELQEPRQKPDWLGGGWEYYYTENSHAALNYLDQGGCADLVKQKMIAVHRWLQAGGWDAHLVLQVHDELVLECLPADVPDLAPAFQRILEDCPELSIPMRAEPWISYTTWAEKQELKVEELVAA